MARRCKSVSCPGRRLGRGHRHGVVALGLLATGLALPLIQVGPGAAAASPALTSGPFAGQALVAYPCRAPASTCGTGQPSAESLAEGSWSSAPGGPLQARVGQASLWTGKELLIWGGSSTKTLGNGLAAAVFDSGGSYDPATRRWEMMPNGPLGPRQDVAAVWAADVAVFWGGDRPVMSGYQDYADGATYNPASGRWSALPPAPISARRGAEAFWTGAQVVVFGGQASSLMDVPLEGASYDVAKGTWSKLPSFPKTGTGSPISSTAVWTGSELLAVVTYEQIIPISCAKCEKGYSISSRAVVAAWSPGGGSWHVLAGTPAHGAVAASTYMARATWTGREIVLLGGHDCLPEMSCPAVLGPSGAAIAFEPSNHSWQPLGIEVGGGVWPSSWTGQALALLAAGGDYQGSQEPFRSAGSAAAFDAATDTWSPLPHLPVSPSDATIVWTGRQLLAWGSTSAERDFTAVMTPANVTAGRSYVEGSVQPCVGPVGSEPRPGAVIAVVAKHNGRIAAVQFVQAPFNFRLVLPPGPYTITASNDIAQALTVRAGVSYAVHLHSACL